VFRQGVRCVSNLLHFVVFPTSWGGVQFETGAMFDTAESWLFQYICAAISVILRDVVQDLERCSAYIEGTSK
jgi:hypothetical protein